MASWIIITASLGYLGLLFGIAYLIERRGARVQRWIHNPYTYALSMAVYCTAWTYYGSVGRAVATGVGFLPIYLGPTLMAPLWFIVLRKIILICRSQRINSIADFISARYGKSATLGGLVAVIAITGIVPYIALQLKAISFSFDILTIENTTLRNLMSGEGILRDTAFYATLILALFTIFFGTRHLEASERHEGLVGAIAFESLVKLVAFLAVGIFVTYGIFDGMGDVFRQATASPELQMLFRFNPGGLIDGWDWLWLLLLSMLAIVLLPRQFHVAVVENSHPSHLKKAIWLFPLYLFLINIFVLPVALGGRMIFGEGTDPDTYVLALPQSESWHNLALFVFVGGLSAASSMVIVSTIALSIMASNHLVVPLLLRTRMIRGQYNQDISVRLIAIRRLIIVVVLLLAYVYFISIGQGHSLVSIGLVSFTAVAQFGPSLIGGIFWRGATRHGAVWGLLAGFVIWGFTLPFPSLVQSGYFDGDILSEGLFGIRALRPYALLGLDNMSEVSHAAFWSLLVNTGLYVGISLFTTPSALEHAQANLFVNIYKYEGNEREATLWRGKAYLQDIRMLLNRFLGEERARELLEGYARRNRINVDALAEADANLVRYAEKLLAGAVGSSSARLLTASVVKEEQVGIYEVMEALDETRQILRYSQELEKKSTELEQASLQLQEANERLREMDRIKDDFITTVTHELRTPITSIRALAGILNDNKELPAAKRGEFLGIIIRETERISRLINQILDLEKMESGHADWHPEAVDLPEVVEASVASVRQLCAERGVGLVEDLGPVPMLYGDRDRLQQVVINLLANAIKFCKEEVRIGLYTEGRSIVLRVQDDGPGIEPERQPYIFDKFVQFNDHRSGRPSGSGLGLSISWRIVRMHQGRISVESQPGRGATFVVVLPAAAD
ncbi:MAG: ATP-binding protein [Bacteroidia bacterium]